MARSDWSAGSSAYTPGRPSIRRTPNPNMVPKVVSNNRSAESRWSRRTKAATSYRRELSPLRALASSFGGNGHTVACPVSGAAPSCGMASSAGFGACNAMRRGRS